MDFLSKRIHKIISCQRRQPDQSLPSGRQDFVIYGQSNSLCDASVRLVVAIEKHFGIKFAFGELQDLKNVGEMAELIAEKWRRSDTQKETAARAMQPSLFGDCYMR